jgi:hypothetical protein
MLTVNTASGRGFDVSAPVIWGLMSLANLMVVKRCGKQ